jgi:hypothetical protein
MSAAVSAGVRGLPWYHSGYNQKGFASKPHQAQHSHQIILL